MLLQLVDHPSRMVAAAAAVLITKRLVLVVLVAVALVDKPMTRELILALLFRELQTLAAAAAAAVRILKQVQQVAVVL